jgi:hypothetical protein
MYDKSTSMPRTKNNIDAEKNQITANQEVEFLR